MTFRSAGSLAIVFALVAVATFGVSAQQAAQTPEARLGAALHHAEVTGDLEKAVAAFRDVIADRSATRATVASALVGLGTAYEKLGRPEARAQYERVVAEFADQTALVSTARGRLAASTPAAAEDSTVSLRRIWEGQSGSNSVSRDGRFLIHGEGMRDLVGSVDRPLPVGDIARGRTVLSPDATRIVFDSCIAFGECELRIGDLGQPNTSRRLYHNADVRLFPGDWSADGKWIAVTGQRADSTGFIGLLQMPEGTLTVLKSTDWRTSTALLFSPDSRYLAFDIAVDDQSPSRDVYAIAVDGSREIPMTVSPSHEALMGWSPDGQRLLFASDRGGSMDLWSLSLVDDRPQGEAQRLRRNIGKVGSLGVAMNGSLYLRAEDNERDVAVTSLDLDAGSQTSPVTRPVSRFPGTNFEPAWSADGTRLAYVSVRGPDNAGSESVLGIRDASGETRELQLRPRLAWFTGLNWSRDGQSIAVTAVDARGRAGIFRVDTNTGEVTPIASPIPLTYMGISWSPDERRIYYRALSDMSAGVVRERDVSTGNEREIALDANGRTGTTTVSPDGRWIAAKASPERVMLFPVDGGEARELHRFVQREVENERLVLSAGPMQWTPDGRALLVWRNLADPGCGTAHSCQTELWLVPTDGGSPRKLDVSLDGAIAGQLGKIRLSPDGRQLAYVAGRSGQQETWVLENFLPPAR